MNRKHSPMTNPDFEALRAERNDEIRRAKQLYADALGVRVDALPKAHDPNDCYCA